MVEVMGESGCGLLGLLVVEVMGESGCGLFLLEVFTELLKG